MTNGGWRLRVFGRELISFERDRHADELAHPRMEAGSAHNFERDGEPPSEDGYGGFGFR